jgi:hypothetical protein
MLFNIDYIDNKATLKRGITLYKRNPTDSVYSDVIGNKIYYLLSHIIFSNISSATSIYLVSQKIIDSIVSNPPIGKNTITVTKIFTIKLINLNISVNFKVCNSNHGATNAIQVAVN